MRHRCQSPGRHRSAVAGKTRSPVRVNGGTSEHTAATGSCQQPPHTGLRGGGGVPAPGCPVPASAHAAVRAGREAEAARRRGRGEAVLRSHLSRLSPAVPSRGSRRGQNPRKPPLVSPREARDPQRPSEGAARPGGGVLGNKIYHPPLPSVGGVPRLLRPQRAV